MPRSDENRANLLTLDAVDVGKDAYLILHRDTRIDGDVSSTDDVETVVRSFVNTSEKKKSNRFDSFVQLT